MLQTYIKFSVLDNILILIFQDNFIRKQRSSHVLLDLIERTKDCVRELDNLQYKRLKRLLINESTYAHKHEEEDSPVSRNVL